jgi:thioredoxin-like negative regulator of GroEL
MAPEYDKLYENYLEKRKDVIIGRIDANANQDISMKYGIFSFPIVVLFRPNDINIAHVFRSHRTADAMGQWIDQVAPKVEIKEEIKFFEDKKEEDTQIVQPSQQLLNQTRTLETLSVINKTEVTCEIDFIKSQIVQLNTKISKIESELEELKAQNRNAKLSNDSAVKIEQLVGILRMPSLLESALILGISITAIALFFTIKKLLRSKALSKHAKV